MSRKAAVEEGFNMRHAIGLIAAAALAGLLAAACGNNDAAQPMPEPEPAATVMEMPDQMADQQETEMPESSDAADTGDGDAAADTDAGDAEAEMPDAQDSAAAAADAEMMTDAEGQDAQNSDQTDEGPSMETEMEAVEIEPPADEPADAEPSEIVPTSEAEEAARIAEEEAEAERQRQAEAEAEADRRAAEAAAAAEAERQRQAAAEAAERERKRQAAIREAARIAEQQRREDEQREMDRIADAEAEAARIAAEEAARRTTVGPQVGNIAPSFSLPNANGANGASSVSLSSYSGSPVVVVFYRSFFCTFCIRQVNEFNNNYQQLADRGIEVVAISSDNLGDFGRTITAANYSFPILYTSLNQAVPQSYDRIGHVRDGGYQGGAELADPGVFLIDGEGRIVWRDLGTSIGHFISVSQVLNAASGL